MKTFKILLVLILLIGCTKNNYKTEPIEKYRNKGILIIKIKNPNFMYDDLVRVKTKDSIFYIKLTYYDRSQLKVGDTIK